MKQALRLNKISNRKMFQMQNDFYYNLKQNIALSDEDFSSSLKFINEKSNLKSFNCAERLGAVLFSSKKLYAQYKKVGIDDKVFFDTMSDITIWCHNCSKKGLKNTAWLVNHLNFELFRLGRLQYQFVDFHRPLFVDKNSVPQNMGEKCIFVHIPQGEKLDFDSCVNSLYEAVSFFDKYFSSYNYNYFVCESWLLSETNKEFMKENSNILKFQSLFNTVGNMEFNKQGYERIFGKYRLFKNKYPTDTSLQKNAKNYILSGGKLGVGYGIIDKNKYKKTD